MNKIDLVVMSCIGFDFRALDSDTLCNSREMITFQSSSELTDILLLFQCFLSGTLKSFFLHNLNHVFTL